MTSRILGIGVAVPECRVTQDEAARAAVLLSATTPEQASRLALLYRQTQIETRHMVQGDPRLWSALQGCRANDASFRATGSVPTTSERMAVYAREALPLALEASRNALANAAMAPKEITHLVTVSCTGFAAPGVDIGLMKALPLPATVERTHVGFMGCHGAFNGLRVARALVEADRRARVLLCAVELCSQHYHYPWQAERMVANALFADGAGAIVLGPSEAPADDWRALASGSVVLPESEAAMSWTIGDHGFEMTLSRAVPILIERCLQPWLDAWLDRHDLRRSDIGSWAIHPGGPRILTSVETALNLPPNAAATSRSVLRAFGNMSSATIVFILDRLRQDNAARPCVGLAFGPGLAIEAFLFA